MLKLTSDKSHEDLQRKLHKKLTAPEEAPFQIYVPVRSLTETNPQTSETLLR